MRYGRRRAVRHAIFAGLRHNGDEAAGSESEVLPSGAAGKEGGAAVFDLNIRRLIRKNENGVLVEGPIPNFGEGSHWIPQDLTRLSTLDAELPGQPI